MSPKRSWIVVVVAVTTLLSASMAYAETGDLTDEDPAGDLLEQEPTDVLLNFGYDATNHVFAFDTSATDSPYDCKLQNGPLTAGYGEVMDTSVPVDTLANEDGSPVMFHPRDADLVGNGFEPAEVSVEYDGAAGAPCSLVGAVVGGPQGQINHGQFMQLFRQLIDVPRKGCLVRLLCTVRPRKG